MVARIEGMDPALLTPLHSLFGRRRKLAARTSSDTRSADAGAAVAQGYVCLQPGEDTYARH